MNRYARVMLCFSLCYFIVCSDATKPDDNGPPDDNQPPEVSIAFPIDGSTVSELVEIRVIASDNEGIDSVKIWVDGLPHGSGDKSEPYTFDWNTVPFSDLSVHTVSARAVDINGNIKDSESINLTVDNSSARPAAIELHPIVYQDGTFEISWPPSMDSDFGSYTLDESMSPDMSDAATIYDGSEVADTSFIVTGLNEDETRYYQLTVSDTLGLQSSSSVASAVAQETQYGLEFDGEDDYVTISDLVITTRSFSVEAWAIMYGDGGGSNSQNAIFCQRAGPSGDSSVAVVLQSRSGGGFAQITVRSDEGAFDLLQVPSPDNNEWHHYAATVSEALISFYIDGELLGTLANSQTGDYDIAIDFIDLGRHASDNSVQGYFNGIIDEVRVWSDVRTQQEIQDNMNKVLAGSEEGLTGYWKIDSDSGQTVQDFVTGNDGTLGAKSVPDANDPAWVEVDFPHDN